MTGAGRGAGDLYVELQVTTHFSFLRGASSPEELFAAAALLGHSRARDRRPQLGRRAGARLGRREGHGRPCPDPRLRASISPTAVRLLVYPTDRAAYGRLCRLLSVGKSRAGKGGCHLDWSDVEDVERGPDRDARARPRRRRDAGAAGADCRGSSATAPIWRCRRAASRATRCGCSTCRRWPAAARVPTVATGDVLYHAPDRRLLQDVVTCIRENCTIDELGFRRERFADRHLKPPQEMERLFRRYPEDAGRAQRARSSSAARFCLSELQLSISRRGHRCPARPPQQALERLTWEKAPERYPDGVPRQGPHAAAEHELAPDRAAAATRPTS